jgi:NAD(P) transhydrogenase
VDPYEYDFVAIGSGPAGQRGAVQAAKLGKRVAIVESDSVGGECLGRGTIPSKTLREAILALEPPRLRRRSDSLVGRPRPSADELLASVRAVIDREAAVVENQLRRNDVALLRGQASFRDAHTLEVKFNDHARVVTAAHILVAVGTRPCPPPHIDVNGETVITSDGVLSLKRLPRTMTVVGAGVIGMEYACMFARLGVEVTLIDGRQRPLEFLDWEIFEELTHQMRDRRVVFRLGEAVSEVNLGHSPDRPVVCLDSGKRILTELVLFSGGRTGRTAGLNLGAAGLTADERGRIQVDSTFRTRVPSIYAAGDVIGFPSLAATSSEQGRLAACHAFGLDAEPMASHFPFGIYSIPEISMVGASEQTLTGKKVPYETGVARYRETARGQILGDESGLLKMLFHRETRALLCHLR